MSGLDEILICARHFPPAYRSGGPPRSLAGLVKGLQTEFRFRIWTPLDLVASGTSDTARVRQEMTRRLSSRTATSEWSASTELASPSRLRFIRSVVI